MAVNPTRGRRRKEREIAMPPEDSMPPPEDPRYADRPVVTSAAPEPAPAVQAPEVSDAPPGVDVVQATEPAPPVVSAEATAEPVPVADVPPQEPVEPVADITPQSRFQGYGRRATNDSPLEELVDPVDRELAEINTTLLQRSREMIRLVEDRGKTNTPLNAREIRDVRESLLNASDGGVFSVADGDSAEKRRMRIWNEIVNGKVPNIERVDGERGGRNPLFQPEQWFSVGQDATSGKRNPHWDTLKAAIEHQIGVIYAEWMLTNHTSNEAGKIVAAQDYDERRHQVSLAIANNFPYLLQAHSDTAGKIEGHFSQQSLYDVMSRDIGENIQGNLTGGQRTIMMSIREKGIENGAKIAQKRADEKNLGDLGDPIAEYRNRRADENEAERLAASGETPTEPVPSQEESAPASETSASNTPASTKEQGDMIPPRTTAGTIHRGNPPPPRGNEPDSPDANAEKVTTEPAEGTTPAKQAQAPAAGEQPAAETTQQASPQAEQPATAQPATPADPAQPAAETAQAASAPAPASAPAAAAPVAASRTIPAATVDPAVAGVQYQQQNAEERAARTKAEEARLREEQEKIRQMEAARMMQQQGGSGGGSGGSTQLGGILSGLGQGIGNIFRGAGDGVGSGVNTIMRGNGTGATAPGHNISDREQILRENSPSLLAAQSNFSESVSHIDSTHSAMTTMMNQDRILSGKHQAVMEGITTLSKELFPSDPTKMLRELSASGGDMSKIRYPEGQARNLMQQAVDTGKELSDFRKEAAPKTLELQNAAAQYANGATAAANYLAQEGAIGRNGEHLKDGLEQSAKHMENIGEMGKKLRENVDAMPETEAVEQKFEAAKKAMAAMIRKIVNAIRKLFGRAPLPDVGHEHGGHAAPAHSPSPSP